MSDKYFSLLQRKCFSFWRTNKYSTEKKLLLITISIFSEWFGAQYISFPTSIIIYVKCKVTSKHQNCNILAKIKLLNVKLGNMHYEIKIKHFCLLCVTTSMSSKLKIRYKWTWISLNLSSTKWCD